MNLLKEETLAKKLITKGGLVYIFSFLIAPTWYAIRVLLSNTLSVGEVWIFYSILWLIMILSAYNDLWLTEALQYFLPKYWIEKKYDYYKTIWIVTFLMQWISGLLVWWWLWLWADWLATHYFHSPETISIIKLFSLYFIAINFLQAFSSVYTAFQDVLYEKVIEMVRMYSVLIFTIVFWLTQSISLTTASYAWMWWLGVWLSLSIFLFVLKYAKTLRVGKFAWSSALLKKQIKYAFWVFLGMNAWVLLWQVDQQMIITILWSESAGYYTNYLSLFTLYAIFAYPLVGLLFPVMTELITKKYDEKIKVLLSILYKYFSVFGLAMGVFLAVLWPVISWVLYGHSFIYSWVLLSYAAGFIVFNILLAINFSLLAGMGKVKERVKIIAIALLFNIAWNILFMVVFWRWLVGAIISTIIWWLIMFFLTLRLLKSHYSFLFDWYFLLKNILIISILAIILRFISRQITWTVDVSRTVRIWYLAMMAIIYGCILIIFNYKNVSILWNEIKNLGLLKNSLWKKL